MLDFTRVKKFLGSIASLALAQQGCLLQLDCIETEENCHMIESTKALLSVC